MVIGGGTANDDFETALIDSETHRFYHLHAMLTDTGLTLRDNTGGEARVLTNAGDYNLMAREYQLEGAQTATNATMLRTTSSAVIHLIDRPLRYAKE